MRYPREYRRAARMFRSVYGMSSRAQKRKFLKEFDLMKYDWLSPDYPRRELVG